MKHLTAILLLCILLFNLFGYRLAIYFLHTKSTNQLTAQIDKRAYKDNELISIKTPLSLPYYTNSETYERVDGIISIEGQYYHYVKRRIFNDSLELLCLPNPTKAKLDRIETEFSKSVLDGSATEGTTKKTTVIKPVLPEFCEHNLVITEAQSINFQFIFYSSYTFYIPEAELSVATPPPDFMQYRT